MSLHNLVSMKRTKKDKKSHNSDHAVGTEEDFPFGLAVSLDDESLTKLGIKELPPVGEVMIVVGIGKVESVSERSDERRVSRNVRIQLEKLEVGPLKAGKLGTKATAVDAVSKGIKEA